MTASSEPVCADSTSAQTALNVDYFGFARRLVPEALLDGSGWSRLVDRVGSLPGSALMSRICGFEFRLGEVEPSADFGLMVSGPSELVDYYVECGRHAPPDSRAAALGTFMSELNHEEWPSHCALEYDVHGVPSGERPDPGLFINVSPIPSNAGVPPPCEVVEFLSDALCLPRDDRESEAVAAACEALPPDAFVYAVGAMPCRGVRAVRLSLEGLDASGVPGFLSRIGWPGPISLVKDTINEMLELAPRCYVALDVAAGGPLPHVGIGLSPHVDGVSIFDGWLRTGRDDWQPLIDHMVATGLCLPPKGDALGALYGVKRLLGDRNMLVAYQAIAYIKITVSDDGVQAKAYAYTNMCLS